MSNYFIQVIKMKTPPERLGSFYLGAEYDLDADKITDRIINYDARDLTTHAICVGMTGSGKTGLCIGLLEEAALDKVPAIIIDPKGDVTNLMLQFPELLSKDFRPWINPDDARRKGKNMDEYSEDVAELWRNGLSDWGIKSERIRALKNSADFSIYTPGSDAGIPVSILSSFTAPNLDFEENAEILRERINGTVSALLGMIGINVDPMRSREAILLTTIFEHFWRQNEDLDLEKLILSVQNPPIRKLGVFDIESYYPEKERFELAMSLNSLIASPSFQSWLQGEPMEIDRMLYTDEGKPRHAIFYIAHLSDKERMFFVTLLLETILTWVRKQTGTTSLRALLYFVEVFGFMPPVAEPPSKRPLLTLLKQARAYGLGLLLVTQNPVDIDYKGLTNAGTWLIGKLQTERDKARVLEGLKSAISEVGGSGENIDYDEIISRLDSRVFLLHNVHEDEPYIFYTRWAMSYLRGPLTRPQVRKLMSTKKQIQQETSPGLFTQDLIIKEKIGPTNSEGLQNNEPVLDPSITQVYLPLDIYEQEAINLLKRKNPGIKIKAVQQVYKPMILGNASVRYFDRKRKIDENMSRMRLASAPEGMGGVNWDDSETLFANVNSLLNRPELLNEERGYLFATIPENINNAKKLRQINKGLNDWLYNNERLKLKAHPSLQVLQRPGEIENTFYLRLQQAAREKRDLEIDKLEKKYEKSLDKLEAKQRKLERDLNADEAEYTARKQEEVVGIGETVLSFFLGRRRTSVATTIARRRRMTSKVKMDVEDTKEEIAELEDDTTSMEFELQEAVNKIKSTMENVPNELITEEIKPRRSDVKVQLIALAWTPFWMINYSEGPLTNVKYTPAYTRTNES